MKNLNVKYLAIFFVAVMALTGCSGLKKMSKKANLIDYKVNPQVLELRGGAVKVDITANIPPNYFSKDAEIVISPYIKSKSAKIELQTKTLQGENVTANNQVINYMEGGQVTYSDQFDYTDDLKISELFINIQARLKADSVNFEPKKLADGIITTPLLVQSGFGKDDSGFNSDGSTILFAPYDEKGLNPIESYNADIHFVISQSTVRKSEEKADDMLALKNVIKDKAIDESSSFRGLDISAYASPDGPYNFNDKLSKNRAKSAEAFIKGELKKAKMKDIKDNNLYSSETTAEDWDGFKAEMEKSNITDKDLILRVLTMYSDPIVREKEIKNISTAYKEVADQVLPKLRKSNLTLKFGAQGKKSDEEILSLVTSVPGSLSVDEFLYAATLNDSYNKKLEIYKKAVYYFPKCWRAQNNLGCVYVRQNQLTEAKEALKKAESLSPGNKTVLNNLGLVALASGNVQEAQTYFESASADDDQVKGNLGVANIKLGNYSAAVENFGNSLTFNSALAKLLNGDYTGALEILNTISKKENYQDAGINYYLKAVVGARMNTNIDMVYNNLRMAVKKDASLKQNAKTDMEFARYFLDPSFQSIVK